MRFLHTSDWHLGRALHGLDLAQAQRDVLRFLSHVVEQHHVDAVLVAGDVYDRAVPSADAVALLNDALAELCSQVPVVLTGGNHDSSTRLGFGSALFADRLVVRTQLDSVANPVLLHDEDGEVAVYPLPFIDPDSARAAWDPELPRTHQAALTAAMDRVNANIADTGHRRTVVMAHAFVVGGPAQPGLRSDSERDITVGGVDTVVSSTFDGVDYVALGHLHGAQTPTSHSDTVLEFCGSPLRYSFSEAGQEKSCTIVDLAADGTVETWRIPIPQPRAMARVRASFAELLDGRYEALRDSWLQITVTDAVRPDDMVSILRSAFPHSLVIRHEPSGRRVDALGVDLRDALSPLAILQDFVEQVGGAPPTAEELSVLTEVVEMAQLAGEQA